MPNRMLRDWTDSDKINSLSVHSERFFTRLIMKVDDYGCFYADTRLLKANLFPLLLDNIREADLLRWIAECQKAGLIVLYENANKKYVQIIDFKQRLDKARSKYPLPPVNEFPDVVNEFPAELEVEQKQKLEVECVSTPTHTQEELSFFKNFEVWVKDNAGNVAKMKDPFTIDQYWKLKREFSSNQLKEMVLKMHNYKPLSQKNNSAYLTFLNWSKKDYTNDEIKPIVNGVHINERLKAAKSGVQQATAAST